MFLWLIFQYPSPEKPSLTTLSSPASHCFLLLQTLSHAVCLPFYIFPIVYLLTSAPEHKPCFRNCCICRSQTSISSDNGCPVDVYTWKSPLLRTILFCMPPSRFHTDFSSLGLESGLRFLGSAPPGKLGLWRQTATFPLKPSLGPAWSPAPHTLSSRRRVRRKVNTEGQEGEELVRGVFLVMLKAGLSPHQRMWNLWQ